MSWDGERTVTFTMEDALISPEGFMILSGAGLIEASSDATIKQHISETISKDSVVPDESENKLQVTVSKEPYVDPDFGDNLIYVLLKKDDEIVSEPYIMSHEDDDVVDNGNDTWTITVSSVNYVKPVEGNYKAKCKGLDFDSAVVDYYTAHESNAKQINISAESFSGNYYLEASTLFRNQKGVDMPAEFIIPNCRVQSNFSFTMASSGDPSSFTFTLDAFPDYTKFDKTQKVFSAIQIIEEAQGTDMNAVRKATPHTYTGA